jgi:tRNA pseudouridine55 synthase
MSEASSPSGLLVIDKPEGLTSMDVCRRVRARLRRGGAPKGVKVGHGGTLDPLATGVLVVMVGKATKLCDHVMAGEKRYLADVDLSAFSATDDREGEREEVSVSQAPSRDDVAAACARFVGEFMQTPPAYSAIKVEGRRAYRVARGGGTPELPARQVVVHAIDVVSYLWPHALLDVRCAKGVYIRSLARDLGRALGTGGMLAGLRRTGVGAYAIEQAVALDDLPEALTQQHLLDPVRDRPS